MSLGRERMLTVIRQALSDVPQNEHPDHLIIERNYQLKSELSPEECISLFAERVSEYRAKVRIIRDSDLTKTIADACRNHDINRLVVPAGIPDEWLPESLEVLSEGSIRQTQKDLDASDGVITGCRLAIAQTGTIILDGGLRQGRRTLTLLPDYHLCIVFANQIAGNLPEAFASLHASIRDTGPPVTFISGPSATSDIELNRVEGVHGPRKLEVLIVE